MVPLGAAHSTGWHRSDREEVLDSDGAGRRVAGVRDCVRGVVADALRLVAADVRGCNTNVDPPRFSLGSGRVIRLQ